MSASLQEPKSSLPDQADRDAARKRLDRNVVVTAGAGTGKTALLTDRLLFTLLGRGVPVQNVVALTFTEKAAGEIRVRLSQRLSELITYLQKGGIPSPLPSPASAGEGDHAPLLSTAGVRAENVRTPLPPNGGEEKGEGGWRGAFLAELESDFRVGGNTLEPLARAALENMDQAPIGTLHSFAAQILRAHPLEAGVDPGFQVDEGDRWEELFESEWAAWLDRELGEHAPREKEWLEILRLCPLEDLEALARCLCQARVNLAALHVQPSGMQEWMQETADLLEVQPKRQPKARGRIEEQLKEIAARLRRLAAGPAEELPIRLPSLDLPNASWPSGWDSRDRDRWDAAKRLCGNCSPGTEALFIRAKNLLRPFAGDFRRRYAWRGLISFDGLLLAARDLARDNRAVREELKAKYRAFLVDEFQDTDPLQGELLMYLAEKPGQAAQQWENVSLEPGKLFVVGDPKQSIYRFRGADIAAYERFVRHIIEQREPGLSCELKSNFRSQDGIVRCVNNAFEKLILPVPGSQPAYHPMRSVRSGKDAAIETVAVRAADSRGESPVARVRRAEAEWIAQWIETHRQHYRYRDIALLFRSTTPLGEYLELFKSRGIPYVVEGEKYFYGTQEVQDFLNLLRVLDDPGDKTALAGLLRSPVVALTDEELRRLAVAGALDYLKVPADARLKSLFKTLRDIRAMVGRRPLGEILQAVFDGTRLLELASAAYHGQQTLANLLKLGRLATDAAENQGETLKGFIHRVSRFVAEAREEGESPLADEYLDAVRMLTIHKSKGLEFPVVILPNLSGKTVGGRDKRSWRVEEGGGAAGLRMPSTADSAAMIYLEEKELRREKDEQIRLLYVAFTRSRDRLILLGSDRPQSQSLAGLLQKAGLWPSLGPGTATLDLPLSAELLPQRPALRKRAPAAPVDADVAAASWLSRLGERGRIESLPRFVVPSAQRAPARLSFASEELKPSIVPADLVGKICHKALERWDLASSLAGEVRRARLSLAGDASPAVLDAAAKESEKILAKFETSALAKRLGRAEILGREVPFVFGSEGQTVRGAIDLLCRLSGRLFVVDYKTDSIKPGELEKKAKMYGAQMKMYAGAASRALGVHEVGYVLVFLRLARSVEGAFTAPSEDHGRDCPDRA